jgi:ribosomal protein S9
LQKKKKKKKKKKSLDTIVDQLKAENDLYKKIDLLVFVEIKGISSLAQALPANISKANPNLAGETKEYFHKLCNQTYMYILINHFTYSKKKKTLLILVKFHFKIIFMTILLIKF